MADVESRQSFELNDWKIHKGVFIQLQPFRHAGNWYVDERKREGGEGEKRGKEEEEGMEKQNENKKGKPLNRMGGWKQIE